MYFRGLWIGQQIKSFAGHLGPVSAIEVSPDGSKILSGKKVRKNWEWQKKGSLDGSLKIWDVSSAKEVGSYTFPSQIFSLTVCPGESWVAVGYVAIAMSIVTKQGLRIVTLKWLIWWILKENINFIYMKIVYWM